MKRTLLTLLFIAVLAVAGYSQSYYPTYYQAESGRMLGGEHTPIIYKDIFTWGGDSTARLNGSDTLWSPWILCGYSTTASAEQNRVIFNFNPEKFTFKPRFVVYGAGDSIRIAKAYWQSADDTTLVPFGNPDTSSIFILSGNYNSSLYIGSGGYLCEVIATASDSLGWEVPLRFFSGGWKRFFIISTATDSVIVDADLWMEK